MNYRLIGAMAASFAVSTPVLANATGTAFLIAQKRAGTPAVSDNSTKAADKGRAGKKALQKDETDAGKGDDAPKKDAVKEEEAGTAKDAEQESPPTEWSHETIQDELKTCVEVLGKIDAVAIPEAAFRKGHCGAAAPIRLISVGKSPQVVLSPPALTTCKLAEAIHTWVTRDLQKLANKHLGEDVIRIEVMSDYACRNAYGRTSTRLSEHALANALDIRGFVSASGEPVRLLSAWGPTERDIAAERAKAEAAAVEAARAAAEKEKAARAKTTPEDEKASAKSDEKPSDGSRSKSALTPLPAGLGKTERSTANAGSKKAERAGGRSTVTQDHPDKPRGKDRKRKRQTAKRAKRGSKGRSAPSHKLNNSQRISINGHFLRAAHAAACKRFGTTLGPEANEAHRNHFHVDMAPRKRSNWCE